MSYSKIEWTDRTWNVSVGCSRVSEGCQNCYAIRFAHRFSGPGGKFEGMTERNDGRIDWTGQIQLRPERLAEPFRWRKPARVFVDSMSDLFHADVPIDFIARVFAVMALTPRHTYQVLTKRPQRMKRLLNEVGFWAVVAGKLNNFGEHGDMPAIVIGPNRPLPNVWLGTSVESQDAAYRIDWLVKTPAAVRFLSCEPLIGPLSIEPWLWLTGPSTAGPWYDVSGRLRERGSGRGGQAMSSKPAGDIHWVIAGGESGPGHRSIDPDWVRSLRDQCTEAGTPFFFKQWGGLAPKAGGRVLDGREWDEFPAGAGR